MKAIIDNGNTYKVISERGAFTYTEDNRGKVKVFQTSTISVVDIDDMPKVKKFVQSWSKGKDKNDCTPSMEQKYYNALREETGRTGLSIEEMKSL